MRGMRRMTGRVGRSWLLLTALSVAVGMSAAVPAVAIETLSEAMVSAYMENPTLRAARARQRACDEIVPQAKSGWRPTITANAQASIQIQNDNHFKGSLFSPPNNDVTNTVPGQFEIVLSQPIFDGFDTKYRVKSGEATVEAGRQDLLATEQNVLFNVTQAFMDVILGRQVLALRERNVVVLNEQLRAAQERFNVGEVTRTDVAQARSRVAEAQSLVADAKAFLASSIAAFVQVVGHSPGPLKYPKIARLPPSLDAAIALAERINPSVLEAAFVAEAARHDINVARSGLLPDVSVQASISRQYPDLQEKPNTDTYALFGVVSIPLYESGRVYSEVRQAKQTASQRRIQIIETERAVREEVASSWSALITARLKITAAKTQVAAAELALEGVKQEYLVGSRTTLDVLNAESELLAARETLVDGEHDQVVSAYRLIAATGRLTAYDLGLGAVPYDPVENYRKVRNKWFGTHVDTVD